ncbi:hypothetical protein ACIA5G_39950 [Amycolatopsis sp. NPDC051758]|uniref:hypothetical protein n=1 Tax=Amycolatopsis sp. NPDC051758 TaxID=3363935 RepID=UPI00379DAD53
MKRDEDDERKRRTDAVLTVAKATETAVKARAANDAALREAFESALKIRDSDAERVGALRKAFESALTDNPQAAEAELAAGRAINAATTLKVTQAKLAEMTEQRVEDLRRWAQLAKHADVALARKTASARGGHGGPAEPQPRATAYAVVAAPDPSGVGGAVDGAAG